MNKQEQRSGDNSTNFQADNVVIQFGLTYEDVKNIAIDVYRANFYQLAGIAKTTANERAEEITEKFLQKLRIENPAGFSGAQDPDFQYGIFTVQKEYARNGDKELGDLLVDLLVDRSKHEKRDILQIVLNESLNIAPKLTSDQLAVLALIFLFKYSQNFGIGTHELLGEYFDKYVLPFSEKLNKSNSCYQHLEYSGCGSFGMGHTLDGVLRKSYQGLFLHGFEASEVAQREISIGLDERFFTPCLNDPSKVQVKALNMEALQKILDANSISEDDRNKITVLFNEELMNSDEIIKKCVSIRPYMEKLFSTWASSAMTSFTLTSVGMAIGHANIKRLVGEFADLSIWIN